MRADKPPVLSGHILKAIEGTNLPDLEALLPLTIATVGVCPWSQSPHCLPSQHPIRQAAGKRNEEETQGLSTQLRGQLISPQPALPRETQVLLRFMNSLWPGQRAYFILPLMYI